MENKLLLKYAKNIKELGKASFLTLGIGHGGFNEMMRMVQYPRVVNK